MTVWAWNIFRRLLEVVLFSFVSYKILSWFIVTFWREPILLEVMRLSQ